MTTDSYGSLTPNSANNASRRGDESQSKSDQSPGKPKVIEVGGRKVSWGDLLASLKKERSGLDSSMQSNRKIKLGDVIASNPLDQEAEAHIIRAVEKVSAKNNEEEEEEGDPEKEKLLKDIASEEISRSSREKSTRKIESPSFKDESQENDGSAVHRRQQSESSLANHLKGKARFKGLVKKHIASNNVEQTLFGLSSALTHMDESKRPGHRKTHSNASSGAVQSSADRFAETAHALTGHASKSKAKLSDIESQELEDTENEKTLQESCSFSDDQGPGRSGSSRRHHNGFFQDNIIDGITDNWNVFNQFLDPRKAKAKAYVRKVFMFIMLPSLAIAAILFYLVENPSLCEKEVPEEAEISLEPQIEQVFDVNGTVIGNVTVQPEEPEKELFVCPGLGASASWWFLFLGVRQIITFTLALITQSFVVDFLALGTRYCLAWLGPVVTLFLVQAKGWPFLTVFWAIYDLILLAGDREYAHHWGYWQDWIGLFNEENPSGNVVDHEWNYKILRLIIFIGVAAALKRLIVSLVLGRQTFARYGESLADIMKQMVLLGEVATLAKDIERFSGDYANNTSSLPNASAQEGAKTMQELWTAQAEASDGPESKIPHVNAAEAANAFIINNRLSSPPASPQQLGVISQGGGSVADEEFSRSQQLQLSELLDAWEEPKTAESKEQKRISIGAVLQFRQALAFMKARYPFLPAFGLADTREHCIESAQAVYDRLLLRTPNQSTLPFDTLALLAKDDDDKLDQEKAKLLIKAFRPDRDGKLTKLDWVRSVDSLYKSMRLLSANISNSSQIDSAVEGIFNAIFYLIIGAISLAWLGVDPFQLFFSFSSFLLVFAFAFGNSSSKYFEGILFILVQSPYGVGDRVHLSRPEAETSIDGSSGWIVEQVSLYTTQLYWGATNERATLANGAVSNLRVINAARSPNAQIFVNMKFPIDTPYEKIEIFRAAVEQFLKDRPREWLAFVGFRPTEVAVDRGYINYLTIAQHRSSWQDIGSVLVSKAELVTYELEVAKKLEMKYQQPHMPVDLRISGQSNELGPQDLADMSASDPGQMMGAPPAQPYLPRMRAQNRRAFMHDFGDE